MPSPCPAASPGSHFAGIYLHKNPCLQENPVENQWVRMTSVVGVSLSGPRRDSPEDRLREEAQAPVHTSPQARWLALAEALSFAARQSKRTRNGVHWGQLLCLPELLWFLLEASTHLVQKITGNPNIINTVPANHSKVLSDKSFSRQMLFFRISILSEVRLWHHTKSGGPPEWQETGSPGAASHPAGSGRWTQGS